MSGDTTATHYAFTIPGQPVPKARPRLGKHGNVYTPRETREYERLVGWTAKASGMRPIEGPVRVRVWVYGKKGRKDADNCLKSVLDGLNGVAYRDDSQVVDAHIAWTDGVENRTVVYIEEAPIAVQAIKAMQKREVTD